MCPRRLNKFSSVARFWLGGVVFALLSALSIPATQAREHQLWGALVVADNERALLAPSRELAPYQARLAKVFGYRNFKVLQTSSHQFSDDSEQWLIPGEPFSLRSFVTSVGDSSFKVSLQLFQGKKELVQTDARLGTGSPLFIRGPLYGDGQLIIVIMVQ